MRSGLLLAVVLGGTSGVVADTLHVPGDFPTIQEAIDAAVDGDEVEVHPGTYFETINFLGKAITVYSTDGPDVTIIDAQQTGTVVTCDSAEGPDSVLEGFTITGGNSSSGGGMLNINSSPTVTNCTFNENDAARSGGGMYNDGSSPKVTNSTFSGNSAGFPDAFGGGMYNNGGSPTVTNCTFAGNEAAVG
ncbi:MAG: right-handed parallel beta-helix repeat-containing protein, partial [Planctomycetes bacterium]|nr:right-handed parallel beta-helix repeat-containing protein [Planctomycetota bacterium]